jgi:hypothetical protein
VHDDIISEVLEFGHFDSGEFEFALRDLEEAEFIVHKIDREPFAPDPDAFDGQPHNLVA